MLDEIKIMSDFEIPLRKALKKGFTECILQGCFFHYCKAIWAKIKKLNLFKKILRLNTILLAFILKVYSFVKSDRREIYCNKISKFCESLGNNYPKLNKYFIKYWKNLQIFDFTTLDDNKIKNRTNNICEFFHSKLNHEISHYHPKCAYLLNELKRITIKYYNDYIKLLSNKNKKHEDEEVNYISNDIIKFI